RAHILTQRQPLLHARSHWLMLVLGWQTGDYREVAGQLTRIFAAMLFSKIWVPIGNTGRSRISAFKPMPVPEELQTILAYDEQTQSSRSLRPCKLIFLPSIRAHWPRWSPRCARHICCVRLHHRY